MKRIKLTQEMIEWEEVDNNNNWELCVEYNGKKYFLYLEEFTPTGPSMEEWEDELEKELKKEMENAKDITNK